MGFFSVLLQQKNRLLSYARASIEQGLKGDFQKVDNLEVDEPGACFVTLTLHGELRGCIGSLEEQHSLGLNVWSNAFNAAYRDPRFPPLREGELADVQIEISVLGSALLVTVGDEQELLEKIRPGIDGLTLKDGDHRATFLPSVWSVFPRSRDFLQHLKRKAGLADDYWSNSIQFETYQAINFSE
jgi:AmmeMemoRadiSam system protein A